MWQQVDGASRIQSPACTTSRPSVVGSGNRSDSDPECRGPEDANRSLVTNTSTAPASSPWKRTFAAALDAVRKT